MRTGIKREIKKFFSRNINLIFIGILFFVFLIQTILITKNIQYENNSVGLRIGLYESYEELQEQYNANQGWYERVVEYYKEFDIEFLPALQDKAIHEYLLKNYEAVDKVALYSEAYPLYSKDSLGVILSYSKYIFIDILIISLVLSFMFFSDDFYGRKHIFVYAGEKRLTILRNKFLAYLLTASGLLLSLYLVAMLYTKIYAYPINTILVLDGYKVHAYSVFQIWMIEILNAFFHCLPYVVVFFFVFVLLRIDVISLAANIGIYFGISKLAIKFSLDQLGTSFFYYKYFYLQHASKWFLTYLIEMVAVGIICIFSCVSFKKRSLE